MGALMAKKAKRARSYTLGPTPEQMAHSPIVRIETMEAGVYAHRDMGECLLDRMREDGFLGKGEDAKRRYEAGMWLRQLFHKAQIAQCVTADYTCSGQDATEMPDHVAWNRRAYGDVFRELPRHAVTLARVCCYDEPVKEAGEALDALADLRGM